MRGTRVWSSTMAPGHADLAGAHLPGEGKATKAVPRRRIAQVMWEALRIKSDWLAGNSRGDGRLLLPRGAPALRS